MPIKFRCPSCRQAYTASSRKAGTKLHCQKCGTKIRVPEAAAGPSDDEKNAQVDSTVPDSQGQAESEVISEDDFLDDDLFDEVPSPDDAPAEEAEASEPPKPPAASESSPSRSEVDFRTAEIEVGGESTERLPPDQYEPPPMDQLVGLGSSESQALDVSEESREIASESELDDVLAFEQALEDEGEVSTGAAQVPLPDELFSDEDDEDEEGGLLGSRAGEDEEMDLTPMVDVTFLLLIFFMITASFSVQKTLQVPPPDPEKEGASTSTTIKEEEEQEQTTVHIDSRNVISVDDEPIPDPSRLVDILRSKRTTDVLITSHENSIHEMLVKVVDAAQEVGMQKIRIGVTKGPE